MNNIEKVCSRQLSVNSKKQKHCLCDQLRGFQFLFLTDNCQLQTANFSP